MIIRKIHLMVGSYRVSTQASEATQTFQRAEIDDMTLEGAFIATIQKGLYNAALDFKGYSFDQMDKSLIEAMRDDTSPDRVVLKVVYTDAGTFATTGKAKLTAFDWMWKHGDLARFQATAKPSTEWLIGEVLHDGVGTAGWTVPTQSTPIEAGAVGAGQEAWIAWGAADPDGLTGTNPAFDVEVESDTSNTFAAPVQRMVVPQITTGARSGMIYIDGDVTPISDTWWRINLTTVAGTDPTLRLLAIIVVRNK